MVFFSSVKNRSHLLGHHVPKILIHISRSFRTDADAPHAADAFLISLSQSYGSSGYSDHQHSTTFTEDFIVNIYSYDGIGSHSSGPVFKLPQSLCSCREKFVLI